jgi:hypothetical protein
MTAQDSLLNCFDRTAPSRIPYLPDLTLWHRWHQSHGTLPEAWRGRSLAQVAEALGVSAWLVEQPWRVEHTGISVITEKEQEQRIIRYDTPAGMLTARWSLGPDGDWWQTEYPVKSESDLPAARAVVAARQYILDSERSPVAGQPDILHAHAAVIALELPMRPYSDLLHTLLGWGEGLMLLMGEGRPILLEMLAALEEKLEALAVQIASLPGDVLLAPDNLDGQYISPRVFREQMAESYRRSSAAAHAQGKQLVVHAGGPVRRLLPLLAQAGVDAVEGVAPPPQSDATLAEARSAAGPDLILWGGIPQDLLLPEHDQAEFEAAVRDAAAQAAADGRMIVGIADRVPVGADIARLQTLARLIETQAGQE